MKLVAGGFGAAAGRSPAPVARVCCLLRCEPVQCHLQHDWHMLCRGQEDTTIACLLRANISTGRQHSPEQIDSHAAGLFGSHDILSSSCFL